MVARGAQREKDDDDGPQSPMATFAEELKAQREAAGLTQEQLGKLINFSASVIAKVETCRTLPSLDFAKRADEVLRTPGTFKRQRRAILNGVHESWVRALLEMEERATVLRSCQPLVVPGLLQTEDYAREIIRSASPGDSDDQIEQIVTARMARQAIWERQDPPPPMLAVILGEGVIRQRVGRGTVMRDQLARLAEAARHPRISIQIMPFDYDAHPGMLGAFVVASFESDPDSAYLDNALDGQVTERRKQVARLSLLYEKLAREALSPRESVEMITRMVEEWT
jgi:transcriptional regulator with XRE-family HTH domain